jgi:hypothetical protein
MSSFLMRHALLRQFRRKHSIILTFGFIYSNFGLRRHNTTTRCWLGMRSLLGETRQLRLFPPTASRGAISDIWRARSQIKHITGITPVVCGGKDRTRRRLRNNATERVTEVGNKYWLCYTERVNFTSIQTRVQDKRVANLGDYMTRAPRATES